jgi:hypothetical protein
MKALGCDTALLLLTLREPAVIPAFVRNQGERCERQVAELVMDGILEVQDGDRFVSGTEAAHLFSAPNATGGSGGRLADLSIEALRYAQALEIEDPRMLAARLYFYNRLPLSPRWERELAGADAVLELVGIGSDDRLHELLDTTWGGARPASIRDGWITWARSNASRSGAANGPTYKLYVSPPVAALREAFAALVEVLSNSRATGFKVGADARGVLRPDKLVAYFVRFDDLAEVAEPLAQRLGAMPVHGVPFTAQIAGDGLLSWGMDPPREQPGAFGDEGQSWRIWVAHRLAAALLAARNAEQEAMPPWQFALQRLAMQGVDVEHWTPSMSLWLETGAEG